jgi:hypothetical protein
MHHWRPFAVPGQKNKLVEISQNYLFVGLDQMQYSRPFAVPGKKNKLVVISQIYPIISNENRKHLTSNACNFLKKIF